MLKEFITQPYLIIEQNIVTNVCLWDGDTTKWTPPQGSIVLIQATTPAMLWDWNGTEWVLIQVMGAGSIGFTWDGSVLTTNESQPKQPPKEQPVTNGTQTL